MPHCWNFILSFRPTGPLWMFNHDIRSFSLWDAALQTSLPMNAVILMLFVFLTCVSYMNPVLIKTVPQLILNHNCFNSVPVLICVFMNICTQCDANGAIHIQRSSQKQCNWLLHCLYDRVFLNLELLRELILIACLFKLQCLAEFLSLLPVAVTLRDVPV